jgi:hypothetical protein
MSENIKKIITKDCLVFQSIKLWLQVLYSGSKIILSEQPYLLYIRFSLSEWLLFNAKWENFQLHHGQNKLQLLTIEMMSALH